MYVAGGTRDGAWSVNQRLEGPAAEAVAAARHAAAERREARSAAAAAERRERDDLREALESLVERYPAEGWVSITVRRRVLKPGTGDVEYEDVEQDLRELRG